MADRASIDRVWAAVASELSEAEDKARSYGFGAANDAVAAARDGAIMPTVRVGPSAVEPIEVAIRATLSKGQFDGDASAALARAADALREWRARHDGGFVTAAETDDLNARALAFAIRRFRGAAHGGHGRDCRVPLPFTDAESESLGAAADLLESLTFAELDAVYVGGAAIVKVVRKSGG